ncbi:hypothetical protein N7492_007523 [Penicillium capsulatum]|uniref:Transcription factor domain-containing protein n=1 Tax=Penicillium capsulatum TaxID=69766 RepID=A0A9W9I260_9EURO|nr:hypothetical protein N7492_007523 [Penicillium capsulatum]KAJ6117357.1 hypothetical protein N7512_007082 [Penicillium capsulatum]
MGKNSTGSTFVVVTGDPRQRQGEQLSQIRSHVAKRLHQRKSRARTGKVATLKPAQKVQTFQSLHNVLSSVPKEMSLTFESPQLPSSAIGQKRMQQFMYEYVQFSQQLHPFFSTVICVSVSNPALMSSKILNASAWDDINLTGEVGNLTLQQGAITRRLLNDSINDGNPWNNVAVATLVAVIIFDLVNDDQDAFRHDLQGLVMILATRAGAVDLGFEGHLLNSLFLIDQLQRAVHINSTIFPSRIYAEPMAAEDMTVFTLCGGEGLLRENDNIQPVFSFLHDLYDTMISMGQARSPPDPQPSLQCPNLMPDVEQSFPSMMTQYNSCPHTDTRIPILQHATHLVRCFISGFTPLINSVQHLQCMLQQTDLGNFWGSLPGALVWCLAIGTRLSPPGPLRKWFMMQMSRSTCALAMGLFDAVLRSVRVVLDALDRAEACHWKSSGHNHSYTL